jgi:hypothetical protein
VSEVGERGHGTVRLLALSYTIAHHSNGQEGCTFAGTGMTDPACAPADFSGGVLPPTNTRGGNYGTNYETLAAHLKWFHLGRDWRAWEGLSVGASWERYEGTLVAWLMPGGFSDDQPSRDLQRIFGRHRVTVDAEYERALGCRWFARWRVRPWATFVSAASDNGAKGRVAVDAALLFRNAGGLGLFTRLFYGQDYYNIRLEDVTGFAIVGLTWDTRSMQLFHPSPGTVGPGEVPPPPAPPPPPPPGANG